MGNQIPTPQTLKQTGKTMIDQYYTIQPNQHQQFKNANQQQLAIIIPQLDLTKPQTQSICIRIPQTLQQALNQTSKLGHKKCDIIIQAATIYRHEHPPEPNWQPTWTPDNKKKDNYSNNITLRLQQENRQLLQNLGRGCTKTKNRYEALQHLPQIIKNMNLTKKPQPKSIYLPLTEELHQIIEQRHTETRTPRIQILKKAIQTLQQTQ